MKYLISVIFLFSLFACATNEEKPEVKTYSEETNRAFEMIERGGSYYLKKAPTPSTPIPQIKKAPAPREEIVIDEKINVQENSVEQKKMPSHNAPAPKSKNAKVDERLVEINQNLAFYCMKHRKDPSFNDDEAKCMSFVNRTLQNCQKIHHIVNSKLLSCIQTKLKAKR